MLRVHDVVQRGAPYRHRLGQRIRDGLPSSRRVNENDAVVGVDQGQEVEVQTSCTERPFVRMAVRRLEVRGVHNIVRINIPQSTPLVGDQGPCIALVDLSHPTRIPVDRMEPIPYGPLRL